ncbi:helix-turn-helix transcriptional regulator [Streptomyces qinglanensis]|uniref:Regulatory protein, luxR family n=1 Tax=Streptomyces qinglanensis TaxID=943816 RepID=A0A1H9U4M0_9ACTN|nr:LuxR C-terminal-related transcriptional regulator [Streptomyces qinglanensis]SES04445.1 regulatory protein, luxR family [Streptomyces qinglanensis]
MSTRTYTRTELDALSRAYAGVRDSSSLPLVERVVVALSDAGLLQSAATATELHRLRQWARGRNVPPTPAPTRPAVLTEQQQRVLELMGQGLTNESIAHRMHITVDSVKTHRRRLYQRLGAASGTQALSLGLSMGLISAPESGAEAVAS